MTQKKLKEYTLKKARERANEVSTAMHNITTAGWSAWVFGTENNAFYEKA